MEEIKKMNDDEMEQAAGGFNYCPHDDELREMGLGDYVHWTGGWSDKYYDTKRDNDGKEVWKNVASGDMLKYVERTFGADDPRYQALSDYFQNGPKKNRDPSAGQGGR